MTLTAYQSCNMLIDERVQGPFIRIIVHCFLRNVSYWNIQTSVYKQNYKKKTQIFGLHI